jgi:hypothetical protein
MKAQTPAQGILKTTEWGDVKTYQVVCECTNPDCSHDLWVEADDHCVTVTIYTKLKSRFWEASRWSTMWTLLTKGYVDYQSSIVLPCQTAVNYAETLKSAVADVEEFRKDQISAATKQN